MKIMATLFAVRFWSLGAVAQSPLAPLVKAHVGEGDLAGRA